MEKTKKKKGQGLNAASFVPILVIVVSVILIIVSFSPVISDSIGAADDARTSCTNPLLPLFDESTILCTNQTYACKNATAPIFNTSNTLCTNASGVGIYNETPFAGVSLVNATPESIGLTGGQETILLLIPTLIVLAAIVIVSKKLGFF